MEKYEGQSDKIIMKQFQVNTASPGAVFNLMWTTQKVTRSLLQKALRHFSHCGKGAPWETQWGDDDDGPSKLLHIAHPTVTSITQNEFMAKDVICKQNQQ